MRCFQKSFFSRGASTVLMALGLWGLVLPPSISASVLESTPESFGATFLFENLSLEFAGQGDGSYAWADSQGRHGVVDADLLNGVEILGSSETSDGQFEMRLSVPNAAGGSAAYSFRGERRDGGGVQGTLVDATGAAQAVLLDWIDVDGDGGGPGGLAPWLVVAGVVAGAGLVVCGLVSIATDCIGDCAAGCGSAGMASAGEGFCGSCTCECN